MGINFRALADGEYTDETEDHSADPPNTCSYCGSQEFEPGEETGRGYRWKCRACNGTMTSGPSGYAQPELIGSPHNHPKENADPNSGGVPGVWAPVLRKEQLEPRVGARAREEDGWSYAKRGPGELFPKAVDAHGPNGEQDTYFGTGLTDVRHPHHMPSPMYHGTTREIQGDQIEPGHPGNFVKRMKHVYMTDNLAEAQHYSRGAGHVYRVQPTGWYGHRADAKGSAWASEDPLDIVEKVSGPEHHEAGRRTAMPGKHTPPADLIMHVETYRPGSEMHAMLNGPNETAWDHHTLHAEHDDDAAGRIDFSTTNDGRDGLRIHEMHVYPEHRSQGIASAMQDRLREMYPHHMFDHGSRTPAGQAWHDQYSDPGNPRLDLDHPDNAHEWKRYSKLTEPEQVHVLPVRSMGYKGFVEAEEGHEERQRAFEREHFGEDMQHPAVDEHLDHAVAHHGRLMSFLNGHIDDHDLWHRHGQVEEIDHDAHPPYATQPYLAGHHIERYLGNRNDPVQQVHEHGMADSVKSYPGTHYPMMVRHEGEHFIVEGHHRVAADMMKGQPTKTFVYDADQHGFPEPDPDHAYDITHPGLSKYARRRVRRCLFDFADPSMNAAHALYNHDDGICVASEQGPRPEPKPLIRGMGPSHDGANCPICSQGLTAEARHRRVREIARPATPVPGTGNVLPAPHPNPEDGSLTWYHGTDYHPDEDHEYTGEHEDWEGPHTGLDGHPVGTGERTFGGDPGGRLKAPVRDAWTAGHHAIHHWNTDLGTHFSSLKSVANQFAGEKMGSSRVAHAHLHMANPAYFDNEHEMGAAAIEHARSKNMHFLPKSDRAHDAFTDGRDDDLSDHPKSEFEYGYVGDHISPYDTDTRQAISNFDKNGVEGHHDDYPLEHIDRYLSTHPRREEITSSFKQHLQDKGHDGIIYGNELEGPHEHPSAIAFHDHQINVHKWDWKHSDKAHMNEHSEPKPHEDQHALLSANPQAWPGAAYGSLSDPEMRLHLVATWADVRNKAKRIRAEGGVNIVVASIDGIGGHVQGDTGVYETVLSYAPASTRVAHWTCGCAWAAYAWNRSPAFKRFEGRMCSHALALQYEAQSKGMFGRAIEESTQKPSWLREKVRYRYDPDSGKHEHVNASLRSPGDPDGVYPDGHGLDLVRAPIYAFVVTALAKGADPSVPMAAMLELGMAHAASREVLRQAMAGYDSYGEWDGEDDDEESQARSKDWDDIHSGMEGMHRGIGLMLKPHDHAIVHDQNRPLHERAEHLMHVIGEGSHTGGVGSHWTTEHGVAQDFAETGPTKHLADAAKARAMESGDHRWGTDPDGDPKGQPATAVVFHAHTPDRDAIDENPDEMAHGSSSIYGYHDHGEREVPIHPGASLALKGLSFKPVHHSYDEPDFETPEYEHHSFDGEGHHVTAAAHDDDVWWHGTGTGDLRGGNYGLHVGTHRAATEAVTARIGHPVHGVWDGSRAYGETLLAGKNTLRERGISVAGHNCHVPDHDHLPDPSGHFPHDSHMTPDSRPDIFPLRITGRMGNTPHDPHRDDVANNMIHRSRSAGHDQGYFYRNVGEDPGSISAVVPGPEHIERIGSNSPEHQQQYRSAERYHQPLKDSDYGFDDEDDWRHEGAKKNDDGPTHAGLVLKAQDTGRILMLQRSLEDEKDPARGTWEFPGGGIEPDDSTSFHGAAREFAEEVGQKVPHGGTLQHVWRSGPYMGHVLVVPHESLVTLTDGRIVPNPDDPGGDHGEQAAWWDPDHARKNPALREECKSAPWAAIKNASRKAAVLYTSGTETAPEVHVAAFGDRKHLSWDEIGERHPDVYGDPEVHGEDVQGDGEGIGWAANHLAHSRPEDPDAEGTGSYDLTFHEAHVDPKHVDYSRHGGLSDSRVRHAYEGFKSGANVPPAVLVHRHGVYQVADGHHRAEGAHLAGVKLPAYVAHSEYPDEPFPATYDEPEERKAPFHGADPIPEHTASRKTAVLPGKPSTETCPDCHGSAPRGAAACPHCGNHLRDHADQLESHARRVRADYAANDSLGGGTPDAPSIGRQQPLPGDQENPCSTGFATAADPPAFSSQDSTTNMRMPGGGSFSASRHQGVSWETGPHIMTSDDYDDAAGAVFSKGTPVHVKRYDEDHHGVGWAVVDHPGGQHGEAYIDPGKIMRQQHGGPDDGAEGWAAHERSYRSESPGQSQHLDHVLGPKAERIPEQHRHLTEAPGNDGRMPWGGHGKVDEHDRLGQSWDVSGLGHEHFDPENAAHHSDEWHAGAPLTPNGLPIRSMNSLHEAVDWDAVHRDHSELHRGPGGGSFSASRHVSPRDFGIPVDTEAVHRFPKYMSMSQRVLHPGHPLVATQDYLDPAHPSFQGDEGGYPPDVVHHEGTDYINDGHHRIIGAHSRGESVLVDYRTPFVKEAHLHEAPEAALPHTDGADDDSLWTTEVDPAHQHVPMDPSSGREDPRDDMRNGISDMDGESTPNSVHASVSDIVKSFQATAAGKQLSSEKTGKGDSVDIAAAAREFLQTGMKRTALKDFSYQEQQELIGEGAADGSRARNFGDLQIQGTHYEALNAALQNEASLADPDDLFI